MSAKYVPYEFCIAYPPYTHRHSPIKDSLWAVRVSRAVVNKYPRWYGGTNAYIDSTLRMVIEGYEGEESDGWERVPATESPSTDLSEHDEDTLVCVLERA